MAETIATNDIYTSKWIKLGTYDGDEHFKCPNCGMQWFLAYGGPLENEMFYCPRCGENLIWKSVAYGAGGKVREGKDGK